MYTLLTAALIVSYILLVWLKTDAVMEYLRQANNWVGLPLPKRVLEYIEISKNGYDGVFADFLAEYFKDVSFFVRLVICPICISFWLSLPFVLFLGPTMFSVAPLALLFYLVLVKLL